MKPTHGPLRFTRLKLARWKNFKKVEVELAPRVFVIGPNASGKSNFLEAFRFVHDLAVDGGGLAKAVAAREGMSRLRSLHAGNGAGFSIEVEVARDSGTKWTYTLAVKADAKQDTSPVVVQEVVTADDRTILRRPDETDRRDPARLRQTAVQQVSANREFRELVEFFASIRRMSLVPQLIREGQSSPQVYPGVDPLGRDFLEHVRACSKGERTNRLKKIAKAMRAAVPSFKSLELTEDKRGRPHLEAGFEHWRASLARQNETQFSDGTLRLIGMLWTLLDDHGPLLLEEPEWSLHTGIIERLPALIARMQREGSGRQVIITTHSEHLLGDPGISPEELLLIVPDSTGGSTIKQAARFSVVTRAMRSGLTAREAAAPLTRLKTLELFGEAV